MNNMASILFVRDKENYLTTKNGYHFKNVRKSKDYFHRCHCKCFKMTQSILENFELETKFMGVNYSDIHSRNEWI